MVTVSQGFVIPPKISMPIDKQLGTVIGIDFIEDPLLKANIIMDPEFIWVNSLLQDLSIETPTVQQKRLESLYSLMDIDDLLRNEISPFYSKVVSNLYENIYLFRTLRDSHILTNLKYIRLINLCVDKCSSEPFSHSLLLREYLFYLLDQLGGKSDKNFTVKGKENTTDTIDNDKLHQVDPIEDVSVNLKLLISELIFFFLLNIGGKGVEINMNFKFHLEDLIFLLVNKHIGKLDFKYALKVKLPTNKIDRPFLARSSSKSSRSHTNSPTPYEAHNSLTYDYTSNKGILLSNSIPNPVQINNSVERTLLARSLVLYTTTGTENRELPSLLWKNQHILLFTSSLVKCHDIDLRLAALKFLLHPIIYKKEVYKNDRQTLVKYLPYLFQSLDYEYLPFWFDPFEIITNLMALFNEINPSNNPVTFYINHSNSYEPFLELLSRSIRLSKDNEYMSETLIRMIQLWASLAAFDEKTRTTVITIPGLLSRLGYDIKAHTNLLNEFIEYYLSISSTGSSEMNEIQFPPLHDSRLVLSWLQLLKAFSRSVTALRTKLQKAHLTETLTRLLTTCYKVTQVAYNVGDDFLKMELQIMGLALGNICNFMVEFSSLQASVLQTDFLGTIKNILDDNLFNTNTETNVNDERTTVFRTINLEDVKTYSLWILRHLMYNCQNTEKMKLLEQIPFDIILDFVNDPSWPVQEQCFQLLRNLTCNSRRVVNLLLEKFKYVEYVTDPNTGSTNQVNSTYLFEYLSRKMRLLNVREKTQRKTLEAILYILNNIAAVNENKKKLVVEQDEILLILKDILSGSSQNSSKYGNDSELKLASLWVLNNLLWNSSLSTYTQYVLEGYTATAGNNYNSSSNNNSSDSNGSINSPSNYNDDLKPYLGRTHGGSSSRAGTGDDKDFIHPYDNLNSAGSIHANDSTVERCQKLANIGLYGLVKQNIFDESLDVREKARTLLYHMDLLLKKVEE